MSSMDPMFTSGYVDEYDKKKKRATAYAKAIQAHILLVPANKERRGKAISTISKENDPLRQVNLRKGREPVVGARCLTGFRRPGYKWSDHEAYMLASILAHKKPATRNQFDHAIATYNWDHHHGSELNSSNVRIGSELVVEVWTRPGVVWPESVYAACVIDDGHRSEFRVASWVQFE